jgi:hypothetical protein
MSPAGFLLFELGQALGRISALALSSCAAYPFLLSKENTPGAQLASLQQKARSGLPVGQFA